MVRDLPLGLLSASFLFVKPHPSCLTTVRLLTKELTIVFSAMNVVVLYFTNQKFKEAVPPWPTFHRDYDTRPEPATMSMRTFRSESYYNNIEKSDS